jgi:hypothetical protein
LYSLRLPELRCDYFNLTATSGVGTAETPARVPVAQSDLILADAGYCSVSGIQSLARQGGAVVVRINPQNFPVRDQRGQRFGLLRHLQSLRTAGAIGEWRVVLGAPRQGLCPPQE